MSHNEWLKPAGRTIEQDFVVDSRYEEGHVEGVYVSLAYV